MIGTKRPLCSRWLKAYCNTCGAYRYLYEGNEITFKGPRTGLNNLVEGTCSSCLGVDVYKTDETTRKDMGKYTLVKEIGSSAYP